MEKMFCNHIFNDEISFIQYNIKSNYSRIVRVRLCDILHIKEEDERYHIKTKFTEIKFHKCNLTNESHKRRFKHFYKLKKFS